jgi:hypothetical protein
MNLLSKRQRREKYTGLWGCLGRNFKKGSKDHACMMLLEFLQDKSWILLFIKASSNHVLLMTQALAVWPANKTSV